ncbi:MAG: hypothetical protein DLM58_14070 [Pseudonocardiales bacterium]|nr:MAG: hypothetical protein DLM58_14070 [Pseudonocardiales bacterium]
MGPYDISAEIIALVAVGVLALATRWVFGSPRRRSGRPVDASDSAELGLLTVVMSGVTRADALQHRAVLGESGIRSSMSGRRDGSMDVLVFHADADRARILLGP